MRVKTEEMRRHFVFTAGKLFVEQGFANVSIELIARKAKKSKVTLYNYYASKDDLLKAYIFEIGKDLLEGIPRILLKQGHCVSETLADLAKTYLSLNTYQEIVELNRLMIAEAKRFPELVAYYYENGPHQVFLYIMEVLQYLMDQQLLIRADKILMAQQFKALCDGKFLEAQLWGLVTSENFDEQDMQIHIQQTVSAFLRIYQM
ncbi:TetR/AcrR family transcriptional repressor of mexJK operon [Acinetobacter baylyi]|uniref:TetR/AcrR family transcriptional repressor of mexJK operon n=1 Tax=Acinetobacter baylyi TaxID=202950 RepID=A0ABU0UYK8_ACIBI|nr:TetR/AcrR family transcriptional regulator [Acinetobacter baylyi]MDQ1209333.1 TetR/AcrR family transcriptional repressor of mexJK operon [Acinetobacter baylyi]MDR6107074.1 TetR/AcrR family transcriptional repressor of mexJK operon [Acinetobacter baylyi]MDR6186205.1 TetR/AcrR family transcriptional repressor of mexJK operon [Acinetobacter baylyi]